MLATKRANASIAPANDPGEFDMVLSNGARDRDGDRLLPDQWAQPLPKRISINTNHSRDVEDIIGSGEPFIDDEGNLRVRGTFASTSEAQHIRQLVTEGHLTTGSVEFVPSLDARGKRINELVGGAFVTLPSNPEARVLESKAMQDFDARLDSILAGNPDPGSMMTTKAAADPTTAMAQAIHDASIYLGGLCVMEPDVDPDSGASDGANKALALRLRLKAIRT